jgi:hypothetical protein
MKWVPAISSYCGSLKRKEITALLPDEELGEWYQN